MSISQVISQSTSQEHISQTHDWLQQRNYCSDSSKEHVSQKAAQTLIQSTANRYQTPVEVWSKFGRNFISDYNLARRSLVEVSSKLRPLEWMDNLENSDFFFNSNYFVEKIYIFFEQRLHKIVILQIRYKQETIVDI